MLVKVILRQVAMEICLSSLASKLIHFSKEKKIYFNSFMNNIKPEHVSKFNMYAVGVFAVIAGVCYYAFTTEMAKAAVHSTRVSYTGAKRRSRDRGSS